MEDSAAARGLRADLERRVAESRWNGNAHSQLANVDLAQGRWADALTEIRAARRVKPTLLKLAERERAALDAMSSRPPAAHR